MNDSMQKLDALPNVSEEEVFPIRNYQELAAAVVKVAADDYIKARKFLRKERRKRRVRIMNTYIKYKNKVYAAKMCSKMVKSLLKDIDYAERDIYECEAFFLSDRFAIFMPNTDGRDFLNALRRLTQ